MQVFTLAEKYIELIFTKEANQRARLFSHWIWLYLDNTILTELKAALNDEYRAGLFDAIYNARTEKPLEDTQSELDTIAQHISVRITLLQTVHVQHSRSDVQHGPLVTEFYKKYYHTAIQHALSPIDVDQIKNYYDELLPPFRTGPIRPYSCVNMKLDGIKVSN